MPRNTYTGPIDVIICAKPKVLSVAGNQATNRHTRLGQTDSRLYIPYEDAMLDAVLVQLSCESLEDARWYLDVHDVVSRTRGAPQLQLKYANHIYKYISINCKQPRFSMQSDGIYFVLLCFYTLASSKARMGWPNE